MRPPSIRATMAAVLVIAVEIWTTELVVRQVSYRRRASHHLQESRFWNSCGSGRVVILEGATPSSPSGVFDAGAMASYHDGLRRKYERAAARPWRTVAPDPPVPRLRPSSDFPELPELPDLGSGR